MNSRQLRKENPEIYRNFFSSYDLIISAPMLSRYPWTGLFKDTVSHFVCEKYPLRNYIGFWKRKLENEDHNIEIYLKQNSSTPFELSSLLRHYPLSFSFFKEIGIDTCVGYLSEYGWSDIPSMAAITSAWSLLYKWVLEKEEIWQLHIFHPQYKDTLRKIIAYDEELLKKFWLFHNLRNNSDFISSSLLGFPCHSINLNGIDFQCVNNDLKYHQSWLSSFILNPNTILKPFFQSDALFRHQEEIGQISEFLNIPLPKEKLIESIEILNNYFSIEIFGRLEECYRTQEKHDALFKAMRLFSQFRTAIFKDALDRDLPTSTVWNIIKENNWDTRGCVIQAGRRLQVFWESNLDINQKILNEIKEKTNLSFTIDYSSHVDGWESEWIKIEQWFSQGITSKISTPYQIVHIESGRKKISPIHIESISPKDYPYGIFIDIDGQIFVNGKQIIGGEIKTHTTTSKILSSLLLSENNSVRNNQLPASSYSKSSTEMNSKILLPLRNIFNKYFQADLPIHIHNKTGIWFELSIGTTEIPIFILTHRTQ